MAVVSCVARHSLLAIQASDLFRYPVSPDQKAYWADCVEKGSRQRRFDPSFDLNFLHFPCVILRNSHIMFGLLGKISRSIGLYFSAVSWLPQRNTCELPKILLLRRLDCTESWTFCSFTEPCSQNLTPLQNTLDGEWWEFYYLPKMKNILVK